jgi:hypothetical protein
MQGETGQVLFHHAGLTILMEMPLLEEIHIYQVQIQIQELAVEHQEIRQLHPVKEEPPYLVQVGNRRLLKRQEDLARTRLNITVPDLKVKEMRQI